MLSPRNTVKSLLFEKERPVRTGSLPFKKRRFPRLALALLNDEGNEARQHCLTLPTDAIKKLNKAGSAPGSEQMAALALVAAAASGDNLPRSSGKDKEAPKKHGFSFDEDPAADLSPLSKTTSMTEAADVHSDCLDHGSDAGKKMHRQPLTSPLPNGCHGRTSRHNSFCRRQPYNGSKFCKSHYLGLIVSGAATEEELMSGKFFRTVGEQQESVREGASEEVNVALPAIQHQDKRYTGAEMEIRCLATTTRGRACGYCAVDNSKYCHLHATFDTHPPPRRGGCSAVNVVQEGSTETKIPQLVSTKNPKTGVTGKPDGSKRRRPSTTKNLKKHMDHAPYPLLSTLSSDKWLHQKVIVSTGPLTNHVGLVEKWGNGWISVRLPGVGLHNRRSFELYLHPNPDSDSFGCETLDKSGARVEVFDTIVDKHLEINMSDSIHEPATPRVDDKLVSESTCVHEVTPLISSRVVKDKNTSRRINSIMFPTCMTPTVPATSPDTIPESPVLGGKDAIKAATSEDKAEKSKHKLESKVPVEDDNAIPLMKSLMLSQHERSGKHRLDWLLSTAAIEKSRRDQEESDKHVAEKTRKRHCSSLGELEPEGSSKRLCLARSPTEEDSGSSRSSPVVSSSDDEAACMALSKVTV